MKVGKSNIKLIQEKLKYYFLLIIISFSCSCAPNVSIESHRLSLEDELKKLRTQNNKSGFKLQRTSETQLVKGQYSSLRKWKCSSGHETWLYD